MGKKANIEKLDYNISYRDVVYPRLEYKTGSLLLVLPKNYRNERAILKKHKEWIYEKEQFIKDSLEESKGKNLNLTRSKEDLKRLVNTIVKIYVEEFGFKINNIFFRKMKTKWASHSSKKKLDNQHTSKIST